MGASLIKCPRSPKIVVHPTFRVDPPVDTSDFCDMAFKMAIYPLHTTGVLDLWFPDDQCPNSDEAAKTLQVPVWNYEKPTTRTTPDVPVILVTPPSNAEAVIPPIVPIT